MMATRLVSLLVHLQKPDNRQVAANQLAHLSQAKSVLFFDKDPERGSFQPSLGFPEIPILYKWAPFLTECATNGIATAMLVDPYTEENVQVFGLSDTEGKCVLSFIDGKPNEELLYELQLLLPFLAPKLIYERLVLLQHPSIQNRYPPEIDPQDIFTSYEQAERELVYRRDIENKLRAADRRKDEFIASISHELRTPLNAILGWAELLRAQTMDQPTLLKGVDAIIRGAKVQANLLNELLDTRSIVTEKVKLEMEVLDLAEVLERARETIEPLAQKKGIQIIYSYNVNNLMVGDAARLRQVFWNLLCNAVKFTPENGYIVVNAYSTDAMAIVSIVDSGMGIEKEFLPFVFDRFNQSDASLRRKYGGLELGLSIAKQFIEMHGGDIIVSSEGAGTGTTFTVKLPYHSPQSNESYSAREKTVWDNKPPMLHPFLGISGSNDD